MPHLSYIFWRRSQRERDNWPASWIWTIRGSPPPPLSSKCMYHLPTHLEALKGHSFERVMCWDHLECVHDWIQFIPLYKPLGFWGQVQRAPHLAATHNKHCEVPSLLNLPPTNREWLAFTWGVAVGNFALHPEVPEFANQQYSHDTRVCFWNFLPCALAVCLFLCYCCCCCYHCC